MLKGKINRDAYIKIINTNLALWYIKKDIDSNDNDYDFVVKTYIDNVASLRAYFKANCDKIDWIGLRASLTKDQNLFLDRFNNK
ncbi:MAG TPA: hypothetical protein VMX17_11315 [Candidatus Glassbacteria bacterium]|nr:hypothetical protein [Candidatus Glassbacteria bacterium]